jgi:hypothetical protein
MGADIECGTCHRTFNTKKAMTDRIMLRFEINDEGKVHKAEIAKPPSSKKKRAE